MSTIKLIRENKCLTATIIVGIIVPLFLTIQVIQPSFLPGYSLTKNEVSGVVVDKEKIDRPALYYRLYIETGDEIIKASCDAYTYYNVEKGDRVTVIIHTKDSLITFQDEWYRVEEP